MISKVSITYSNTDGYKKASISLTADIYDEEDTDKLADTLFQKAKAKVEEILK
jgi:hypothetical protein